MYKTKHIKQPVSRKVFVAFNVIFLFLLAFLFVAPYLNIMAKAFNTASDTARGGLAFWPRDFTWDNISLVFSDSGIIQGLIVSVWRVIIGTLISLVVTYMAGYALLQKGLWGRGIWVMFLSIPMFISGGLIANYIIFAKIGIFNNFWVYVLPTAFSFFNMTMVRTYLTTIPDSLSEAARIDGANEFVIMWKIMLPLSMPIVATLALWSIVGHWNNWTDTLYYIRRPQLYTLQYQLQLTLKESEQIQMMIAEAIASGRPLGDINMDITGESIQAALIIVSTIPMVIMYPFLQKYFLKGMMIGGVKE